MHVYHFGFLVIIIPVAQQGPEHETEAIYHGFEGLVSSPTPNFLSATCISLLQCLELAKCSPLLGSFLFLMTRRLLPQLFLRLAPFHQPGLGSNGNTPEKSCFLHWLKYGAFPYALDYSTALNH